MEEEINYVTLKSKDSNIIKIPISLAYQSNTIHTILTNDCFIESTSKIIELPFSNHIINKAIEYMTIKLEKGSFSNFKIEDNDALDLLEISNYLKL